MTQPELCADIIAEYEDNLVLVDRYTEPKGKALPGGRVEAGETFEEAAKREFKEETGMELEIGNFGGIYDDPDRDPRGHKISKVFSGNASGEPGNDERQTDVLLQPLSEVKDIHEELVFDHEKILTDYLSSQSINSHCNTLLHVDWADEAERVRMAEVIEDYQEHLTKLDGTVRMVEDSVDVSNLAQDLLQKLPENRVKLYNLEQKDHPDFFDQVVLEYRFDNVPQDIERTAEYIIQQKGGKLKSPVSSEWALTRNGYSEVEYNVIDDQTLEFTIYGPEELNDAYRNNFEDSLEEIDHF